MHRLFILSIFFIIFSSFPILCSGQWWGPWDPKEQGGNEDDDDEPFSEVIIIEEEEDE